MQQVMNDGHDQPGARGSKRTTNNIVEAVPPIIQVPIPRDRDPMQSCQSLVHLSELWDSGVRIASAFIHGSTVMSRPRRKMFGPLFYTTVVVAILFNGVGGGVYRLAYRDGLALEAVVDSLAASR